MEGLPESALVFVDDRPVSHPIRLPRGEAEYVVRIEAEGFAPFVAKLHPSSDQTIVLDMVPLAAETPSKGRRKGPRPRGRQKVVHTIEEPVPESSGDYRPPLLLPFKSGKKAR
jgi:hypothetical protein